VQPDGHLLAIYAKAASSIEHKDSCTPQQKKQHQAVSHGKSQLNFARYISQVNINTKCQRRILSAVVITAGGVWFTTGLSKPAHSQSLHDIKTKIEEHKTLSPEEEEEKKQRYKEYKELVLKDAPKPEHGGSSVLNHSKAAEANEHKIRRGKFSGKDFDNDVEKHSRDPGKDFEFVEKKETKNSPK
jgi:hypothetical protein